MPTAAVVILAFVVLRWCGEEFSQHGHLTREPAMFAAMCVWLHAFVVVLISADGIGRVGSPFTVLLTAGIAAGVVGAAVAIAGIQQLGWQRTLGLVVSGPEQHGIYRRLNHPIYAGWVVMLLGVSIAGQSAVAAGLTAVLGAIFVSVARRERAMILAASVA